MNDRRHISEEELLLLVTGELDAAREAEAWAAVAEDAGLARAAARIEATLAAVRAEHAAGTSGDFNSRLRRRVLAEAEAGRPCRWRQPPRSLWPGAS
jgi:anti-sigma factor RsiW